MKNLRATKTNYLLEKGELEDLFLECVEEVKKDIYARKIKTARLAFRGPKNKRSITDRPVEDVSDIKLEDFKEIDKRKVIELFIS